MKKITIIPTLLCWYALYIYIVPGLPWNSSDHPAIILVKYFPGLFVIPFFAYSMYSTFCTLSGNTRNVDSQTTLVIGQIVDIDYSNIRINNQPRFKVLVKFNDYEKEFDPIEPKINIDFRKGDNVYIWINPVDKDDSYLDLDKSLAERESLLSDSSPL